MPERVSELVARVPVPMVLHGGTGLSEPQFHDLIARGCAKVNISTALKVAFVEGNRAYLEANPGRHDPTSMLEYVREAVKHVAAQHLLLFGSAGRARRAASPGAAPS
jgi:fructose/tagatose bisphosphate aldolase